jgi:hypothetical protein
LIWINNIGSDGLDNFKSSVPPLEAVLEGPPEKHPSERPPFPPLAAFALSMDHSSGEVVAVPSEGASAVMLPDHLCNTGGTFSTLDLNGDYVGDAQGVGRHVLCLRDGDAAPQA